MATPSGGAYNTEELTSAVPLVKPVEYNVRDLIIYALGIGSRDLRYIYEKDSNFAAFPTYPIVLTFKGESFDVSDWPAPMEIAYGWPRFDGTRFGLDAGKCIERLEELPPRGAKLLLEGRYQSVQRRPGGVLLERLFNVVDDKGKVYYKMVDAVYLVGATNFKESGTSLMQPVTMPSSPPTHCIEVETYEVTPALYRLSGDYNPLHIDQAVASKAGFEKPILHGQCTMGHVTRAVLEKVAAGDHRRFRSVQLRFTSPVVAGDTLVVEIWQVVAGVEYAFQAKTRGASKLSVSYGSLKLHPEGRL